jgi:phytoene dehydrogenase-like protein
VARLEPGPEDQLSAASAAALLERRFAPRTDMPGLYLFGAATHPGGSVIGVNGRNAADAVLADTSLAGARR